MRDFFEILQNLDLYDEASHNKTDMIYKLNGNLVEFFSIDQPQKVRGGKRDYLFCNEANELPFEAWQQLIFRTTEKIIIDYNPSDEFHWIYDKVITRADADFYKSTYKDNPFLDKSLVAEIERLQEVDENYWRVYGLGERAVSTATIYGRFGLVDSLPSIDAYGLDFGYNHPTALIAVNLDDDRKELTADEVIYKSNLTIADLIAEMARLEISENIPIYCDHSRPEAIEELKREGYDARPANKAVFDGINFVKGYKLKFTKESENLIKEARSYKWKERSDGVVLDEPVKFFDDAMDALRYGAYSHYITLQQPKPSFTFFV
jgi:phage terminase large subunit